MANISITRNCDRHCSYCFAKHELAHGQIADMPDDVYEKALDFLERSNFPEARLLGGEPTNHPRFCEYIDKALQRDFHVIVFSGGLIPQPALEYMAALPAESLSIVLNTADPSTDPESWINIQRKACRKLGRKITLGVNILFPNQNATYLFDWIDEFNMCRRIRLGIAHPIWGGNNFFYNIRRPRQLPVLEDLFLIGISRDVTVSFDCGFTPCMFSPGFVDAYPEIFTQSESENDKSGIQQPHSNNSGENSHVNNTELLEKLGVRCNPVIDILPEGDCIACYALSRFRRFPIPETGGRNDLVSSFINELLPTLPIGVYRECLHCDFRIKNMCQGGCRARRAMRLRPDLSVPLHS